MRANESFLQSLKFRKLDVCLFFFMAVIVACWMSAYPTAAIAVTPIKSNGSLGDLTVGSGAITFKTNHPNKIDSGIYFVNGVKQNGTARVITLPQNSGGVSHEEVDILVWDFANIDLGADAVISIVGASGLTLLSSGQTNIEASFDLSGDSGENGGINAGGGGGAGGGVLSIFSGGDLTFLGNIDVSGSDGGSSFQEVGNSSGGSGGLGSAGGGSGGNGGSPDAGGKGGIGGAGAIIGFKKWGLNLTAFGPGGGGGGGGAYGGGIGAAGASNVAPLGNGNPGQNGLCPFVRVGGGGGIGFIFGLANFGGDGGDGGDAPLGTPGAPGGSGFLMGGGGGAGGGGDLCTLNPNTPALKNGGSGGNGGQPGDSGDVILTSELGQSAGGGGGAGQVFLGTDEGFLTYGGAISAFGGAGADGGRNGGLLTLIVPSAENLVIQPSALFNGVLPDDDFITDLSMSNYLPIGGGGGGGGGGSGLVLVVSKPSSVPLHLLLGVSVFAVVLLTIWWVWRRWWR